MRSTSLGLLALALVPRVASATDVWTVGGGGDFASIQAALDAALPGDRLLVAPGTYTECLSVDFDVDILATGGSGDTTIQCTDNGRPYAVEIGAGAWVRMDGFTIDHSGGLGGLRSTGGSDVTLNDVAMSDLTSTTGAGCIDADSGVMRVHDATLTRCFGTNGGAVRMAGTSATLGLVSTVIDGGDASLNGGGVYFLGGTFYASASTIRTSIAANYGGGLFLGASGSGQGAKLTDVVVEDCVSEGAGGTGHGGGIYTSLALQGVDVTLQRNEARTSTTFSGGEGGGLYATSSLTLVRGEILDNSALFYGGGVHGAGGATLYGTRLAGNTVGDATRFGYGGGLSAFGTLTTHGTTIESNTATTYGGGVYAGTWTSRDDIVASNAAIPAVLSGAGYAYGGGAFVGNLDARWTRFSDNVATGVSGGQGFGGGAYVQGTIYLEATRWARNGSNATYTTDFGGAIYATGSGTQTYHTSYFDSNVANTAGAVFASASVRGYFYRCEFQGNQAKAGHGGAVYQSRAGLTSGVYLDIDGSFFRENTATDGSGGAIYVNNTGFEATSTWFTRNSATDPLPATTGAGRGGAIHFSGGTNAATSRALFCRNQATSFGGAVYGLTVPTSTQFTYSVFQENSTAAVGSRGGAYYEDGRSAASGLTNLHYSTFAGNTSVDSAYAGVGGNSAARLYSYQSVYKDNTGTALRNDNPNASTLYVYNSDFQGHTTAYAGPGLATNPTYPNYVDAFGTNLLPGWVVNANCFDDDLTAVWRTNGASTDTDMYVDRDGDGDAVMQRDCELSDGSVWIGATEIRGNGVDDDCFMGENPDSDKDGYSPDWMGGADCWEGADWVSPDAFDDSATPWDNEDCVFGSEPDSDGDGLNYPDDCDPGDPLRNDFVAEVPYDGVQQSCATSDDDADLDGGDRAGFGNGWDCDDTTDTLGPFVHEVAYDGIDQNCDGRSDFDADMDGVDSNAFGGTDCDDADATRSPATPEVYYDGLDSNCVDDNDYDADGDGFVATAYNAYAGGTATGTGDCDDANPNTFPGADEITDGLDNTCDGVHNPDPDLDGDGVLDNWEVMAGTMPNVVDTDGDGISDGDEWGDDEQNPRNVDGDGEIDALDLDADGDSVFDAYEGTADTDGDGTFDAHDPDDDGDGIPSAVETDGLGRDGAPDTDKDGTPDWLDVDSDADGALDVSEGTADVDGDGLGAWRDDGKVGTGADQIPDGPEKYGFGGGACSSVPATPSLGAGLLGLGLLFARRRREPAAR